MEKRSIKVQIRLRPQEAEALRATIRAMGLKQTEALRGWIAAGMRGQLPVEGVLMSFPVEPADTSAEAVPT
jgi:hypothetical protein